jgi:hypothetical protein
MRLLGRMFFEAARLLEYADVRHGNSNTHSPVSGLTTGYFVIAIK